MATQPQSLDAVLAVGQTKTPAVNLRGRTAVGLYTDGLLTGTAITFEASHDGVTFVPLKDGAGNSVGVTVAISNYVPLNQLHFAGVAWLKVVSGTTQATAASTFTLAVRPL